jgi:hypothetical protein
MKQEATLIGTRLLLPSQHEERLKSTISPWKNQSMSFFTMAWEWGAKGPSSTIFC